LLSTWLQVRQNSEANDLLQLPKYDHVKVFCEIGFSLSDLLVDHGGTGAGHRTEVFMHEVEDLSLRFRRASIKFKELDLGLLLLKVPGSFLWLYDPNLCNLWFTESRELLEHFDIELSVVQVRHFLGQVE